MDILTRAADLMEKETTFCLATIVVSARPEVQPGRKVIVLRDGSLEGTLGTEPLDTKLSGLALEAFKKKKRQLAEIDNGIQVFVDILTSGTRLDTALSIHPSDFKRRLNFMETMNIRDLTEYIEQLKMLGESSVKAYQIEKHKRYAFPFSAFILTLIGVSVSSRKVKGGIGMQLGIGLMVAFSYLLFMQFSSQFAIGGDLHPVLAVWLPNAVFTIVAIYLYRMAPK